MPLLTTFLVVGLVMYYMYVGCKVKTKEYQRRDLIPFRGMFN